MKTSKAAHARHTPPNSDIPVDIAEISCESNAVHVELKAEFTQPGWMMPTFE